MQSLVGIVHTCSIHGMLPNLNFSGGCVKAYVACATIAVCGPVSTCQNSSGLHYLLARHNDVNISRRTLDKPPN